MGMTIDEAITWLNTDDYESKGFADATSVAINTMRKYQQLQADYENRLKADMVAMLTEIQLEIEEWTEVNQEERMRCEKEGSPILETIGFDNGITTINRLIQQKINSLKEA